MTIVIILIDSVKKKHLKSVKLIFERTILTYKTTKRSNELLIYDDSILQLWRIFQFFPQINLFFPDKFFLSVQKFIIVSLNWNHIHVINSSTSSFCSQTFSRWSFRSNFNFLWDLALVLFLFFPWFSSISNINQNNMVKSVAKSAIMTWFPPK